MKENNKRTINILIHDLGSVNLSIIKKIKESKITSNIYVISNHQVYNIDCTYIGKSKNITFVQLKEVIKKYNIDFAIVFNEAYSAKGLVDYYREVIKIPIIGTTRKWFKLESSKIEGKTFMIENGIKTPEYEIITNIKETDKIINSFGLPVVIKDNNLRAGFGSYICQNKTECKKAVKKIKVLSKKYKNDNSFIIEKFVKGKELSQQYMWDEKTLIPFLPVKDYKREKENNKGINTGGLGSYTPINLTEEEQKLLDEYNKNLAEIFQKIKPEFTGIFTVNLLFAEENIYTLEINMRPGITEFETTIEHISSDLLELLYNCATGSLQNSVITYKEGITGCVALVHKEYSRQICRKRKVILEKQINPIDNEIKINLNIPSDNNMIYTNKRILSVLCTDNTNPFSKIYKYLDTIKTKNLYYRKDIGQ